MTVGTWISQMSQGIQEWTKICGRQLLKNLKLYGLLTWSIPWPRLSQKMSYQAGIYFLKPTIKTEHYVKYVQSLQ